MCFSGGKLCSNRPVPHTNSVIRYPISRDWLRVYMATPIRKKRNFKALQLRPSPDTSVTMTPGSPPNKPTTGKKRPPPMTLKAPKIATTSHDHDGTLLTVSNGLPSSAPPTASASKTYHSALSEKLANFGEDLKNEDLKDIQELGQGNGGSVKKVEHTPTGMIMAKKVCVVLVHMHASTSPIRTPSRSVSGYNQHVKLTITRRTALFFPPTQITYGRTDRVDRCKTISEETDPAGAADHARLQLAVHHFFLRRVHLGPQHLHLHGIYG